MSVKVDLFRRGSVVAKNGLNSQFFGSTHGYVTYLYPINMHPNITLEMERRFGGIVILVSLLNIALGKH
jgi:hypothetical protein